MATSINYADRGGTTRDAYETDRWYEIGIDENGSGEVFLVVDDSQSVYEAATRPESPAAQLPKLPAEHTWDELGSRLIVATAGAVSGGFEILETLCWMGLKAVDRWTSRWPIGGHFMLR